MGKVNMGGNASLTPEKIHDRQDKRTFTCRRGRSSMRISISGTQRAVLNKWVFNKEVNALQIPGGTLQA